MKANAPEKIYSEKYIPITGVLPNGLNYSPSPTDEYISEHIEYYMKKDKMCNIPLCPLFAKQSFIEDFRNYMKGE